ncbi:MAG: FKBP-type peptidyl-prolyl cis-trans isomerase [Gemmatimonadetes bacterium]|nr:FKBP-type peptidyl-prolyl cis-trans isomerase [Gemmatimonadota bacterium]
MIKRSTGSAGRTLSVIAAVTLAIAACGGSALGPDPSDAEFAASLGIDLATMTETTSGLFVLDVVVGTGEIAAAGDSATVAFEFWLADATPIQSGVFPFILGTVGPGGAIAGFDEGVTGMAVGGERTIVIPASLAFGSSGVGNIPGNAVLIYELNLTAVRKPPF